jgi:hypothetical protein
MLAQPTKHIGVKMFLAPMVCNGLTYNGEGIEVTELSPVCLEGRVIYTASFDPSFEHSRVASSPERATGPHKLRLSSNSTGTRLFVFGIAAGVIAAMTLGQHHGRA